MNKIEREIEVDAPLTEVYRTWTDFAEFPRFMEGVTSVERVRPNLLVWTCDDHGRRTEWVARITEEIEGERIAWEGVSGRPWAGEVILRPNGEKSTLVLVSARFDSEGFRPGTRSRDVETGLLADLERLRGLLAYPAKPSSQKKASAISS